VQLWDVATGRTTLNVTHPGGAVAVAVSFDGKRLATCGGSSRNYTLRVWDTATGAELAIAERLLQVPIYLSWLPDGKRILGGTHALHTTTVWDAATGYETMTLKGNLAAVGADGRRVAYWSPDWALKVWDASTRQRRP
jgi:WD40 repeat protein